MTSFRIVSFFAACTLTGAFASGCRATPQMAQESAIDFVVRPGAGAASRAPSGSFDVRGIDNAEHTRVGIGGGTPRTLHVRLPAGAYALAWNPAIASGDASSYEGDAGDGEWPQIVVVTNGGPTTVDVHLAAQSSHGEPRVELASAR